MTGTWKRGHAIRGRNAGTLRSLPPPDMPDEELDDLIDLPPDDDLDPAERADFTRAVNAQPAARALREVSRETTDDDEDDDGEPAHIGVPKRERERAARPSRTGAKIRVTAAVQKDVLAKIRFVAVPAGRVWASSDPVCGGTFLGQEPEISGALAEIVCDSPDLLAWFTGPQGKYMKFFNLFMACMPVGMAVYGHHLAHRPDGEPDGQAPPVDYAQFAA